MGTGHRAYCVGVSRGAKGTNGQRCVGTAGAVWVRDGLTGTVPNCGSPPGHHGDAGCRLWLAVASPPDPTSAHTRWWNCALLLSAARLLVVCYAPPK